MKLTQEQYDNRDKSMTHYAISDDGVLNWHNENNGWMPIGAVAIPDMEFDITKYSFSATAIEIVEVDSCNNVLISDEFSTMDSWLSEKDSIALAKHFGHYKSN